MIILTYHKSMLSIQLAQYNLQYNLFSTSKFPRNFKEFSINMFWMLIIVVYHQEPITRVYLFYYIPITTSGTTISKTQGGGN